MKLDIADPWTIDGGLHYEHVTEWMITNSDYAVAAVYGPPGEPPPWRAHVFAAAQELFVYARLEEEYSWCCNRLRPDWDENDIMVHFVDKYKIQGPIGKWLGDIRRAAIAKAEDRKEYEVVKAVDPR